MGCTVFTEIVFPDVAQSEQTDYGLKTISASAFSDCTSLVRVHLPDTVTAIYERAFQNCTHLSEINYPKALTTVNTSDSGVFEGCLRLVRVEIPEGVTVLAAGLYAKAPALKEVILPGTLEKIDDSRNKSTFNLGAFQGCTALESIQLPESLSYIGFNAFRGCVALPNPTFPKALTYLGPNAYMGCTSFTEIVFPDVAQSEQTDYGLKTISASAFSDCTSLVRVHLPDTVTAIYERAFQNCTHLSEINYPKALTTVNTSDSGVFEGCLSLARVEIPDGVTVLAAGLYAKAPVLKEVILPGTLEKIDDSRNKSTFNLGAFQGCTALESIQLPESLNYIGVNAFRNCTALGWTYVPEGVTTIAKTAFDGFGKDLTIESEYGAEAIAYAKEKGIPYYYLSLTNHARPEGTLYLGYPFYLYGYVRGSIDVTNVTATLSSESGEVLQSVRVQPYETDYSLSGAVSRGLDFSVLPLGNYTFTLEGETELTRERFYTSSFRIVKMPLTVKLRDFDYFQYVLTGSQQPVSGSIVSNYAITSVDLKFAVEVSDDEGNVTENDTVSYSDHATGGAATYDLSNLGAFFYSAKNAEVHMTLSVVSDGKTKTVCELDYIVTDEATPGGMIQDTEKLNLFVKTRANRTFFDTYGVYAERVANTYASSKADKATLWLHMFNQSGYNSGNIVEQLSETLFGEKNNNRYFIDHFKDEITEFIDAVGGGWISDVGFDGNLAYQVQEAVESYPNVKDDAIQDLKNVTGMSSEELKMIKKLIEQIETIEPLLDAIDSADDIFGFAELLYGIVKDYTCGLKVLDYLENTYSSKEYNAEYMAYYQKAVRELREEYVGEYLSRVDKMFSYLETKAIDAAIKAGEKTLKSAFKTSVESILGITIGGEATLLLSITKILWKTYTDQTDFYSSAETYVRYMTIYITYLNAYYSYQDHFDAVYSGDTSLSARQELVTSFNVTRLAGIRLLRYLYSLPHMEGNDDLVISREIKKLVSYKNYFYISQ